MRSRKRASPAFPTKLLLSNSVTQFRQTKLGCALSCKESSNSCAAAAYICRQMHNRGSRVENQRAHLRLRRQHYRALEKGAQPEGSQMEEQAVLLRKWSRRSRELRAHQIDDTRAPGQGHDTRSFNKPSAVTKAHQFAMKKKKSYDEISVCAQLKNRLSRQRVRSILYFIQRHEHAEIVLYNNFFNCAQQYYYLKVVHVTILLFVIFCLCNRYIS